MNYILKLLILGKFLYCTTMINKMMRSGLCWILGFCSCICIAHVDAQDCTLTHYGVNEGLSQSSVYLFLEDKNGLIWIGTGDGLNLFDGYDFKIYKHSPENDNTISNNTIRSIIQDNLGRLWIGTDDGLNLLDRNTDKFSHLPRPIIPEINPTNTALKIVGDEVYCFVSDKGLFIYNTKNQTFRNVNGTDTSLNAYANQSDEIPEIYFPKPDCLVKLNTNTGKTYRYPYSDMSGKTIMLGNLGKEPNQILIKSNNGLNIFNSGTGMFLSVAKFPALQPFIHKDVSAFCIDNENRYWISVNEEGLYCYSAQGKLLRSYIDPKAEQNNSASLKHIDILYADREGNIWAGTQDAGFFKISLKAEKFNLVNIKNGDTKNQLSSNFIKCFFKTGNTILVGTFDKGLNVINTESGKVNQLKHVNNDLNSVCSNTINSITEDSRGNIWICSEDGLCIYNPKSMNFEHVYTSHRNVQDNFSPFIYQMKNGDLLHRRYDRLYKVILKNKKWIFEPFYPNIAPAIVWENNNGDFLFSNRIGGLFILKGQNYISIPKQMRWPRNLANLHVNCFYKDVWNNIWFATNMGLIKADNGYHFLKLYGLKDGLPDEFIYGILGDKNQRLWISTNKGISCFDPSTLRFRNYAMADGLQSNEFNSGAYYKAPDGEMYFGGINGFNFFYPEQIADNQHKPIVRIKSIKLFDKELPTESLSHNPDFSYNQNTFSFEVSAVEYTRPADNAYAYKLEGDENKWYYAGKNRNIRYSNLAPGSYALWVKAANSDGIWSVPSKLYQFEINPPYWNSWWFRTIICFSAFGFIVGITRFVSQQKLKKLLAKSEREREIEKIRIRISNDIHDDIGAGLSRLAMISEITKEENKLTGDVITKLDKLSSTSRELMTSLREIVWAMNPKNDQADSLLSYLRTYTYNYFEDSGIDIIINFPDEMDTISFNPEMRRNIFLIIKEAFNNALKYAVCSTIELSFQIENGLVIFEIKDNGIGFDKDDISEFGNGLLNMYNRCEAIGGQLEINSASEKGTKICLKFELELLKNS